VFELLDESAGHRFMLLQVLNDTVKQRFCSVVHSINVKRGRWSPLPKVPERLTTEEIIALLTDHPHWFMPIAADSAGAPKRKSSNL